ncbi:MarR family transcriptional regulator [Nocardioides koreensis]|uniref:MarR family transcriptional regulator n=1 Tax=Nocardioides koreensis TaxID=433651 RepID=A0ABP5KZD5_9ACTN
MTTSEELADEFLAASRVLVGLAVQSLAASPVDVTLVQYRVLVLLAAHGELTIGAIAGELGVNPSNATRHCDRLQRLGLLVRRRCDEDGRVVRVALTSAGRAVVDAVTDARRRDVTRILDGMSTTQWSVMLKALRAFSEAAHEPADREWVTHVW